MKRNTLLIGVGKKPNLPGISDFGEKYQKRSPRVFHDLPSKF